MKERPIIFSASMVRAILSGSKSQTRRIAKKPVRHPDFGNIYTPGALVLEREPQHVIERACPFGQPGDRLWVRETWQGPLFDDGQWDAYRDDHRRFEAPAYCQYAADGGAPPEFFDDDDELQCRWRPSIHMPRWASRISLEITGVRVERLQDISEADAKAEGLKAITKDGSLIKYGIPDRDGLPGSDDLGWPWAKWCAEPRAAYRQLWESIHGVGSWDANPFVWVVEFRRIEQ